jgi:hypothetical protein
MKNMFKTKYTDQGAMTMDQKIVGALFLIDIEVVLRFTPRMVELVPRVTQTSSLTRQFGLFMASCCSSFLLRCPIYLKMLLLI